jgi:hypothetical protein
MFDDIISTVSGLNIFDLRQPHRFRFQSIAGFGIYLVSYMLVVLYDQLFQQQCFTTITTGWQDIAKNCGLTAGSVIFPFLYIVGASIVISLLKRPDWSTDAAFNNLSLVILTEAIATAAVYQRQFATLQIQTFYLWYFPLLSVVAVAVLAALSLLAGRHSRPPKWTLAVGIRASPGIFRLLTMYILLSAAFYIGPFAIKFGVKP